MWKLSRITLLLILIFHCVLLYSQGTQRDSIRTYFQQISKLVETKERLKEDFFNTEFLLAQNTHLQNKEKLQIFLELFTVEKEQKNLLLKANDSIEEVIQKNRMLELENIAQKEKFNTIIIILALLFIISSLAVFSYLKVKQKNKLLMTKTIQLTKIQVRMKEKLADYQKSPPITVAKKIRSGFSKDQSTIDKDVQDIILSKLDKLEKEYFFLDANCSLHQLAEQLKTNPKYLSQVINQAKKTNFTNYINELRINHLLPKLLTDLEFRDNKLNYIAVSLGYNNLNTFNAAFKKRLGILPSNFIEELNSDGNTGDEGSYVPSNLLGGYNYN